MKFLYLNLVFQYQTSKILYLQTKNKIITQLKLATNKHF